jgi:hypothetical protein
VCVQSDGVSIVLRRDLVGLAVLLCSVTAAADRPPRAIDRAESNSGKFFARLDVVNGKTAVYRKVPGARDEPLWEMPGYHNIAFLSDNPDYFVTAYQGGCLLSHAYRRDEEMLFFYRRGRLIRSVKLNELIRSPEKLRRTASHLRWCESMRLIGPERFRLRTADGQEHIFDITTGQPVTAPRRPPSSRAPILDDR